MKKIFIAGEVLVEIMADTVGRGFLEPTALTGPFPSGAPAIFADQVALLNHPVALAGCVGKDDFGQLNVNHLRGHGVDTSAIDIHPEKPTGTAFVRYRADGARDFVFNITHSASGAFRPNDTTQTAIESCVHMHVVGSSLGTAEMGQFVLSTAKEIKSRGGTVSFDPNIRKELLSDAARARALHDVLRLTDVFLPSDDELAAFCPDMSREKQVSYLHDLGIKTIVHKNGQHGATLYDNGLCVHQPAFPSDEIDPTGAGDCFGAVFTTLWLQGYDPGQALKLAAAAGALAVRKRGPMSGNSTLAQIQSLANQGQNS